MKARGDPSPGPGSLEAGLLEMLGRCLVLLGHSLVKLSCLIRDADALCLDSGLPGLGDLPPRSSRGAEALGLSLPASRLPLCLVRVAVEKSLGLGFLSA